MCMKFQNSLPEFYDAVFTIKNFGPQKLFVDRFMVKNFQLKSGSIKCPFFRSNYLKPIFRFIKLQENLKFTSMESYLA